MIADPASEWMKAAVALVFAEDLGTSRRFVPVIANDESSAYRAQAAEMLEATVEERRGRIHVEAFLRDLKTQRNRRMVKVEGPAAGLIATLNGLAKRIDADATDYSTRNQQALRAFAGAAQTSDTKKQLDALNQAIALDPGFGMAYLSALHVLTTANPGGVKALLAKAQAHEKTFTPLDRARFDELASRATHAPLQQRASAASALLRIAPNNLDALTGLAAVRFLQGDEKGAALLKRASEVDPGNASIQMNLAGGLLETKQFPKAEKIFQSLASDPDILPDLAACILLEGDPARADSVFKKYLQQIEKSKAPFAPLAEANWLAISGKMPQAISRLAAAQFAQPDLESIAWSQIAVWQAAGRNVAAAKRSAAQGAKLAKAAIARVFAEVAMLIANADLPPSEWRAKVEASPLNNGARQTVLGYGFFLFGHYAQAAQVWQALLKASGNADLRARAMLASSLEHSGKKTDARKILVQPFLPNLTGGDPYAAIAFAQMQQMLKNH
ncbi:MAG TPA: hypothetical protein VF283_15275 [Bryobacteraceae bacterium]